MTSNDYHRCVEGRPECRKIRLADLIKKDIQKKHNRKQKLQDWRTEKQLRQNGSELKEPGSLNILGEVRK